MVTRRRDEDRVSYIPASVYVARHRQRRQLVDQLVQLVRWPLAGDRWLLVLGLLVLAAAAAVAVLG